MGGRGLEGKREQGRVKSRRCWGCGEHLPAYLHLSCYFPSFIRFKGHSFTKSLGSPPCAPLPRVADEHTCLPPPGGSKAHRPSSAPWDRQPSPPPLFLPPAVPWPRYPGTAAACFGDPQARNYYRAMPLDLTTKIRRRRRCGRRQGGQGLKTSSERAVVKDKPWGPGLGENRPDPSKRGGPARGG